MLDERSKLKSQRVSINGIWFSMDGSVAPSVIENLIALRTKINKTKHANEYDVCLWTDKDKLNIAVKSELEKNGIIIKDYKKDIHIDPNDIAAIEINDYVQQFADPTHHLVYENNKLAFAMASDMFRMYLVFNEIPRHQPNTIPMYIDCNDIEIRKIPSPSELGEIDGIAFPHVNFKFPKILNPDAKRIALANNDVIIAAGQRHHKLFKEVFELYHHNLQCVDRNMNGLIASYKQALGEKKQLSNEMAETIVFGSTHLMGTISFEGTDDEHHNTCLIKQPNNLSELPTVKKTDYVKIVKPYLQFKRHEKRGQTWAPHGVQQTHEDNSTTNNWIANFKHRTVYSQVMSILVDHRIFLTDALKNDLLANLAVTQKKDLVPFDHLLVSLLQQLRNSNKLNNESFKALMFHFNHILTFRAAIQDKNSDLINKFYNILSETLPSSLINLDIVGSKYTLLSLATEYNNFYDVQKLLQRGATPNVYDHNHSTPLHTAIAKDNFDIANLLIQYDANLDLLDDADRITPIQMTLNALYTALNTGDIALLQIRLRFLVQHLPVDQLDQPINNNNDTFLRLALECKDEDTLEILLKRGANPNIANLSGVTPLHFAAHLGQSKAVKLLLQYGANPNSIDSFGNKPINIAPRESESQKLLQSSMNQYQNLEKLSLTSHSSRKVSNDAQMTNDENKLPNKKMS